ncbi:MAG: hypothetical protein ACRDN0_16065, partial [Trebonia sp.]
MPAETGTGIGRDVTEVPVYAGRNVGMTRAQARAELRAETVGDRTGPDATDGGGDSTGTGRDDGTATRDGSSQDDGSASTDRPPRGAADRNSPDGGARNAGETGYVPHAGFEKTNGSVVSG